MLPSRFVWLLSILIAFHGTCAAQASAPSGLVTQVDRLVQLLEDPGSREVGVSSRGFTQVGDYWVVNLVASAVGGSLSEDYLAFFTSNPGGPYTLVGAVAVPDWVRLESNLKVTREASRHSQVLAVAAIDNSGEPPGHGMPILVRYEIEMSAFGPFGVRALPYRKR